MPRVQVYLPDDLHGELKRRGLPASELLQIALRAELERQDALDATATYLAELATEVASRAPASGPTSTRSRVGCAHVSSAKPADVLVLDSGAVTRLSARTKSALSLISALNEARLWPPIVPTVVLVEWLQSDPARDANANRFLETCIIHDAVPEPIARRAAELRRRARAGSAVDAVLVALAEPGGTVLTGDRADLESARCACRISSHRGPLTPASVAVACRMVLHEERTRSPAAFLKSAVLRVSNVRL